MRSMSRRHDCQSLTLLRVRACMWRREGHHKGGSIRDGVILSVQEVGNREDASVRAFGLQPFPAHA
jgi:hypothetical protein